ncbi:TrkH family potassium uptake protein [Pseudothauera nasutitermitis]|uniref:Trk system potassium uptake protein n=1 Tax=Pseudothauera nasutitermitis TaxID=2565930 RepID=A0A4S4AX63_9RHOO|nr:potassium transporter TrkG [Pseudothauera nasutitermitis]THF64480.1 TrkH family potassium uptake protein [Pseudothauera nasutitermitis]
MRPYFPAFKALGLIVMIFGLLMAFPLIVSFWLNDGATPAYDKALLITVGCGALLWMFTRSARRDLRVHDGFLLVVSAWVVLPVFGALPLLAHLPELSFTHAYFEAASGLTATGATILREVEDLPVSINLWRTFMHWIGGMGVIVLVVAILPLLGIGGRQMFQAEVPTPMKESSLTPRITETAKGLWMTYILLTVACGLSFRAVGLDGWDALIHAFTVTGLGGFSSKDASLGHFDSVGVEVVTIVFALLAGLNYATHYLALARRSLRPYLRDPEIRHYFAVLAASIGMLTFYLTAVQGGGDVPATLRAVAFHVVSIATSLGLTTQDYTQWPMFAQLWILFLGSFIACSGSTGGGIKMMRAMILYKQFFREIIRSLHPQAVSPVRLGEQPVSESVLHAVLGFSFMYMVSIVSLTLTLSATGLDIVTAFSAVVACINNTGPGLGGVGPAGSYADMNTFQSWLLAFTMILGRLEIFTFLVVLTPSFWRR